jgi:heme exporter protein D
MGPLTEFLAMGGYAAFVWPAFAVVILGMAGLLAQSLLARRKIRAELARLEAAGGPHREAQS